MKTTDDGVRVTDEELAEVARLDAEATEGPWTTDGGQVVETEYQIDPEADEGERADVCEVLHYGRDRGPFRTGTARFIARARTLLPRFRDEVIALRAEVAERAEHAEALDDVLARIVAAWRDDEIGAIDGALIEEAEKLLGIVADADPLAAEPAS